MSLSIELAHSALVCVLVFGFCTRLGFPARSALTLALIYYGLGTIAWPYSKTFYSGPLVTMFLLSSIYVLVFLKGESRLKLLLAGGLWGAAIMVKLTALIVTLALNVPDFWFVYLWLLGIPGSKLALLVSGLVVITLLSGYLLVSQVALFPQEHGARATVPDLK